MCQVLRCFTECFSELSMNMEFLSFIYSPCLDA